jgi:hypothetical protein
MTQAKQRNAKTTENDFYLVKLTVPVWTGVIKLVKFAQLLWAKRIQANGVHGGLPATPTPQYTTELPTLYLDGRPDRTTGYLKGAS